MGFAVYFQSFSTFLGKPGIYLEDLFVVPEWRGRGIGRALLAWVARAAVERGAGRMEWSVLDWNELALGVYRRIGARPLEEWTVQRLTGDALRALAFSANCASLRSSSTVAPETGSTRVGAIAASGSSTNSRSRKRGCGTIEVRRAWPAALIDPHVTEQNQVEIQRARRQGHGPFAASLELDLEQRVEDIACGPSVSPTAA